MEPGRQARRACAADPDEKTRPSRNLGTGDWQVTRALRTTAVRRQARAAPARRSGDDAVWVRAARSPRRARASHSRHWSPSHSPDSAGPAPASVRSRVTLATTEAAAIEKLSPSPPTTVSHGAGERRRDVAVDERDVRADPERRDRARHRQQRRAQDVDACRSRAHSPHRRRYGRRRARRSARAPASRPRARRRLSTFESSSRSRSTRGKRLLIEHHRGGDDRTGERPAPGLVDAADDPRTAPLDREIRHRPSVAAAFAMRRARPGKQSVAGDLAPTRQDRYVEGMCPLGFVAPIGRARAVGERCLLARMRLCVPRRIGRHTPSTSSPPTR